MDDPIMTLLKIDDRLRSLKEKATSGAYNDECVVCTYLDSSSTFSRACYPLLCVEATTTCEINKKDGVEGIVPPAACTEKEKEEGGASRVTSR